MSIAVHIGSMEKPDLLQALYEHNIQLNSAAETLFDDQRFTLSRQVQSINITRISVADLGFDKGATYAEIILSAKESGLAQCPLELGPYLRLQYLGQPEDANDSAKTRGRAPSGSITIASPQICDDDDTPKGFYLRRDGSTLWLRGYWASSDHIWKPQAVFLFTIPDISQAAD